jgi:hypothetical protein
MLRTAYSFDRNFMEYKMRVLCDLCELRVSTSVARRLKPS